MTPSAARMDRAERARLEREVVVLREIERRRKSYPLAYVELWHNEEPRTSQRRALLPLLDKNTLMLAIFGGNRAGKSDVLAQYGVALAAGLDAYIDGPEGRVYWVRRWLDRNQLPHELIPNGPGRVWFGSPTFSAAVEQIRPKLKKYLPAGTSFLRWDDKQGEAEARLPNGAVLVSKAYKQYDNEPQTWEGAAPRAILLDEQPNRHENLLAALSRLVDECGPVVLALTPLKGKANWLYREVVHKAPSWLRVSWLYGEDNPFISQERRREMIAAMPKWQQASRDRGEFTNPEGAIYSFDRAAHVVDPFRIPERWTRWQGFDWGARAPHVIWAAEVPERFEAVGRVFMPGDLIVYREYAPRRTTVEPGIAARKLIEEARRLENGDESIGTCTVYRVADSEDPGAIAEAAEQGWWLTPAAKGPGSVAKGIELVDALLQTVDPLTMQEQRPRLFFLSSCPTVIEEMEGMRWAEVREGQDAKPDDACPDHGPDALRYIVQMRAGMGFR